MKDIKDKTIANRLNNCRKIREVFGQRSLRSITPTEYSRKDPNLFEYLGFSIYFTILDF